MHYLSIDLAQFKRSCVCHGNEKEKKIATNKMNCNFTIDNHTIVCKMKMYVFVDVSELPNQMMTST